ncbi:MAG: type IV secretion system protein VirD4 [Alphaproteobacteria bacterium RIFCSPLOWO2_01_FULL_40_26]|nr:MAG: type IV secretion system protein VirD4 [Alphaproteobacteria bacterium RIFCSPHIGHO2_02_FULL_40_34]OFW88357.1 MAG: type IV secretion system protein VirD4 [Alphaproteobacteria bacterium RIFCSPHIGHO2_01_FULL_40_8]OFW94300.1 MAG: type IV secretion system protein VirD4 [Alphaproteobacteria bacterium RIFCSPLOWO2_01_FULL_40_26]OFX09985.1 MAG: type IV secretion system protein VirD4 [Alphaproteobacteria bacterium RIFCSPLOWO2_02_FULL_40_19]OFX12321.1 MAG: type IV secretion system protein VirD4 [Al
MAATNDNPLLRNSRNFVIITLLICFVLAFCFYITGTLVIVSINGNWEVIKAYSKLTLDKQFIYLAKTMSAYWKFYFANSEKLTTSSYNGFTIKLWITTILPYALLMTLTWTFRAPIMDWRPFKKPESIHGDSHFATDNEIKKMGLRAKTGVLLGTHKNKLLIADGYQHILLFAPTGSGKGVGFVIPNLLFWKDSVIVHDIKLENYELTSGWRRKNLKQKVFLWNPADPDGVSHCYNPMDWISKKPGQMVDDVQKICNFLLPEQEFWQNEARALLTGIMLYLVCPDVEKPATLGEVVRTLRNDDVVYNLAVVLDTLGKRIHPVSYMNIASYLQKPDKERGSVTSTANSSLELWSNPLIDTTTATSDFNLHEFKISPHTCYVGLTPDNISRLKPLMNMFYQQAAAFFTARLPQPHEKFGVLMMMDEFPTLGKMEQFLAGIAYFRGYRVRLFLIIQDTEQLKGIYEESGMNSFLSNATYRVTFAANNMETANLISQLLGNKTATQISYNKPKYLDLNPGARSLHVSDVQRALLLPQEVIQLPRDEQIILIESQPPIKSKKIFYFKDKFFTSRLLPKVKIPKQEPYMPDHGALKAKREEDAKAGAADAKPETAGVIEGAKA